MPVKALDLSRRVTRNFTLGELLHSATAEAQGLDNTPDAAQLVNIEALAAAVLQPLRSLIARGITVNSCFRAARVNRAVGGAATSQHMALGDSAAADIEAPGLSNLALARVIENSGLPYDQLILEHYIPGVPSSGWVHVSHRKDGGNRRQVLTIPKGGNARRGLG